jgi:hypothetical protein
MKFLPNRFEFLALASVWLIWPALAGVGWAISPAMTQFTYTPTGLTSLGLAIARLSELGIPSIIGTGAIVAVSRFARNEAERAFLYHLVTIVYFLLTIGTMIAVTTLLRS